MTEEHNKKTIRGISWNFLRVIVQTVFSLAVMAILARLLPPEDFGLLAIALIFVGFAELLSSLGMGPAVVQRKSLSDTDVKVAQTLSLLVGTLLTLFCIAIAAPIASWYENPQIAELLQVLAFTLFISAAGAVSRSLLTRQMRFKAIFFIDLIAYFVGYPVVAVLMAYKGFGVWSLVWGHMSLAILASVLAMITVRIPLTVLLEKDKIKSLVNFGVGVSLSSTVNYVAANIDYLVIMRFLNATILGLYSRAYHLITLPLVKISITVTSVLFSSMSAIQDDKTKVRESFYFALEAMSLLTFPILFVFFVASEIVIIGVFGEQWYGAVDVFRILSLAGILKSVFHLSGTVAQATGNVYAELKLQIIYFFILLVGCLTFIRYGMEAIAWVTVAASLFLYLSKAQLALKIIEGSWGDYFKAQIPALTLSLTVAIIDLLFIELNNQVIHFSHWSALLILIFLSAITSIIGFFLLPNKLMGQSAVWLKIKARNRLPAKIGAWL